MNFNLNTEHPPRPPVENDTYLTGVTKPKGDGLRSLFSALALMAAALAIAFSVAAFVVQSYQVDGDSMETTLQNNDRLIVNKLPRTLSRITKNAYIPDRGDIIVFNQVGLFDIRGSQEKQLIKRVVGLPHERIVVDNGFILVYNSDHPNGFNPDLGGEYEIERTNTPGKVDITLGEQEIFVAGDNRPNSEDSRYFGAVEVNAVVGKLVMRVLPANKAQRF
jgi:signal peptidase I